LTQSGGVIPPEETLLEIRGGNVFTAPNNLIRPWVVSLTTKHIRSKQVSNCVGFQHHDMCVNVSQKSYH